jgi:hypothetical protein
MGLLVGGEGGGVALGVPPPRDDDAA